MAAFPGLAFLSPRPDFFSTGFLDFFESFLMSLSRTEGAAVVTVGRVVR